MHSMGNGAGTCKSTIKVAVPLLLVSLDSSPALQSGGAGDSLQSSLYQTQSCHSHSDSAAKVQNQGRGWTVPRAVGAAGAAWVAGGVGGMIRVFVVFTGSGWLQCPFLLVPSLHGFLFFGVEYPSCRLLSTQLLLSSYCQCPSYQLRFLS
jgi:hypothetical protein